jgi:hypothetical protein
MHGEVASMKLLMVTLLTVAALALAISTPAASQGDRHATLDRILDTYVRGGSVYYRALKIERAALDRYVQTLDVAPAELARWTPAERKAFWLNGYNALVLRTVINAYPIRGTSADYPADSIRQIPGAFDRLNHPIAGDRLTLDAMETHLLEAFGDARIVLALGRGARGSGRLRSEAFRADRLETQLEEAVKECAERVSCVDVDLTADRVTISPLLGWRAAAIERTFVPQAGARWPQRTLLERAVAAMVSPFLFPRERDMLAADTFRLEYGAFDWSLNEL